MHSPKLTRPAKPSLSQIEAGLDCDRAALATSAAALRDAVALDKILPARVLTLTDKATVWGRRASATVAGNPLAVGMTLCAVAGFVLGRRAFAAPRPTPPDPEMAQMDQWADEGGAVPPADGKAGPMAAVRRHLASQVSAVATTLTDHLAAELRRIQADIEDRARQIIGALSR